MNDPLTQVFRQALRDELYATVPEMIQQALADAGKADAYTADQLAAKWSCSRASIDKLVAAGELRAVDGPGRARLIRAVDAAAYLERQAQRQRGLRAAS